MPTGGVGQVEERNDKRERRDAKREVYKEEPSPREGVGDPTAGQRTRDQSHTEHASQIAHVPPALPGAYDVAEYRQGERLEGAHTQTLDSTGGNEPPEPLCHPRQDRGEHEDDEPRDVESAPAVDVGELSDHGYAHCHSQKR